MIACSGRFVVGLSAGPVHVAAVADPDHLDDQARIDDLVEDPVVTDPYSVHRVLAREGDAAWGPRLVSQQIYRGANSLLFLAWQPRDRSNRPAGDLYRVPAHSSPSATLTSSHRR